MYYLPEGASNERARRYGDGRGRNWSPFFADGSSVGETERRREAGRGTQSDVSREGPVRNFGVKPATILVPVDCSKLSEDAVRHVIGLSSSGMAMKLHLLNVQPAWAPARSEYEKREGIALHLLAANKATEGAQALLRGASLEFEGHLRVGPPPDAIARFAQEHRCDKIVMGTRRLGTFAGLFLGSVASRVLRLASVPVTLVRPIEALLRPGRDVANAAIEAPTSTGAPTCRQSFANCAIPVIAKA